MKPFFWLLTALLPIFCISCENDSLKHKANVTGYWKVDKAFRDKRETMLLADVFFQFGGDGKMFTNLPNTSEDTTGYEMKDGIITQKTPVPIQYNIVDVTDTTLLLTIEMNNTPFEIHLKKTTPPPPGAVDSLVVPVDTL